MHQTFTQLGEHVFRIHTDSAILMSRFTQLFVTSKTTPDKPVDLTLAIHTGYATSAPLLHHTLIEGANKSRFADEMFQFVFTSDDSSAEIFLSDPSVLKDAFLTLYGTLLIRTGWGLLIHGRVEPDSAGKLHLCVGTPETSRQFLPVRLNGAAPTVFTWETLANRSALQSAGLPLASVNLVQPAFYNQRIKAGHSVTLLRLLDQIAYWPNAADEARQALGLLRHFVHQLPVYSCSLRPGAAISELIG
ncbi:MAG: hypothetical protein ABF820_06500 [Sporolactobacillus sp.]